MTTRTLLLCGVAILIATRALAQTPAPPAAAPTEPQYPIVRVGVLSYLQYDEEFKNRDNYNNFDVTRAYLNVTAQVSKNIRFRFTPDIRRSSDGNLSGSLVLRVKYAYAQFDNVTPNGWIRLGAHQTPWLDFEESIDRYRVQGTMFAEREGLIPGSSDFGASYFTPLPAGFGEIHAGVYNGEGYAQPEANKYKSVQGRITVRPLPKAGVAKGFRISGFYNAGWYAANRPRRLGIVMGSFEHPHLVATVQGLKATENPLGTIDDTKRSGWSVYAEPRQGVGGLAGIFRYEEFDPSTTVTTNSHSRLIFGGAYWLVYQRARVGLVVTNEQVRYDSPVQPEENRLLFQTHVEF